MRRVPHERARNRFVRTLFAIESTAADFLVSTEFSFPLSGSTHTPPPPQRALADYEQVVVCKAFAASAREGREPARGGEGENDAE